jgi:hypothetical protein
VPSDDVADATGSSPDEDAEAASPSAGAPTAEPGVAAAAAKSSRDAVSLSAASSAAFAAAAAWAAAGESGSKPAPEPPTGPSRGTIGSPMPTAGPTPATGGESAGGGQTLAGGHVTGGDQTFTSGQPRSGQPSAGQAPESVVANAPAPPAAPGSPSWQAAARPAESLPSAPVDQPTFGSPRPSSALTAGASAPWLAESELAGLAGAPARQVPVTPEIGRQPLIIAASSDPPWVEKPDEATVAWVPPVAAKGPTDTPWAEPDVYRSEIEVVKPPDELGGPAPSGIICSACGTENESHRRFCRSCGHPLFAVESPQPEFEEPKRRSWRWLAILVPVLLVAGLLGFVGAALIRGGLFASASPTTSFVPVTAPPDGPTPTSGPTVVQLKVASITASSRLGDRWTPSKAIDGLLNTSWQEGARTEAGQWIQMAFKDPVTVTSITIFAGSQTAKANYDGNLRPRHITVSADGGPGQKFELGDVFGQQEIAFSGPVTSQLRITINDTYPSKKTSLQGSPFDDCAISELQVNGTTP